MDSTNAKRVRSDHAELIELLEAIYTTLIELRYLHADDIVYPPYGVSGKPSLDKPKLWQLGFTDEVIALLEQLPYPTNELMDKFGHQDEGVPIAPDSSVVSYLAGIDFSTARQPFCDGEVGIPAWAFKFTTGGLDFGTTYIYDTRLRQIVRWSSQAQFEEYYEQPHRPCSQGMSIMVGELHSLDWLAWRVECSDMISMNIYSRPTYKQHMSSLGSTNRYSAIEDDGVDAPTNTHPPLGHGVDWVLREIDKSGGLTPTLKQAIESASVTERCDAYRLRAIAIEHGISMPELPRIPAQSQDTSMIERVNRKLEVAKAVQNRYMYKRNLFEYCGWPDNFRGDEFVKRRYLLEKEHFDLIGLLGPQAMRIQNIEEGRYLREWYRQKAGINAAC